MRARSPIHRRSSVIGFVLLIESKHIHRKTGKCACSGLDSQYICLCLCQHLQNSRSSFSNISSTCVLNCLVRSSNKLQWLQKNTFAKCKINIRMREFYVIDTLNFVIPSRHRYVTSQTLFGCYSIIITENVQQPKCDITQLISIPFRVVDDSRIRNYTRSDCFTMALCILQRDH